MLKRHWFWNMYLNLHDLKFIMYAAFGFLGLGLLCLTGYLDSLASASSDPISYQISEFVTFLVGAGSIFFCIEAILLRGEDDIWQ